MSSFINKVKKRLSLSGPSSTSPPPAEGATEGVSAPPTEETAPAATNGTSTVSAVPATESQPDATIADPVVPPVSNSDAYAEDDVAPDALAPPVTDEAPRRSSQDFGLDASKHKPSHFSAKLGAAEILHAKETSFQRRHGSVSGYEHYGSGNN